MGKLLWTATIQGTTTPRTLWDVGKRNGDRTTLRFVDNPLYQLIYSCLLAAAAHLQPCWYTFSEQEIQIFYWQNTWSWWNAVSMEGCHVHDMPQLYSAQQCVGTFTNAEKTFSDSFQSSLSLAEWIGMPRLHRAHVHNAVRPCVLPCMWTSASPATLVKSLTPFGCISIISSKEQDAGTFVHLSRVHTSSRFFLQCLNSNFDTITCFTGNCPV